jgi:hypothetical protein
MSSRTRDKHKTARSAPKLPAATRPAAGRVRRARDVSPALREQLAAVDARLDASPDPLAHLTRERFEANRAAGHPDTLGVGPRLAPRR